MINVVGFDLGGVYLTDCWSRNIREEIAKRFHFSIERLELNNAKAEKLISEGKIIENDFLNRLVEDGKRIEDIKKFIRDSNRVIFPEILELMKSLKPHYKLVLMNNEGKEWNEFRIKQFHLIKIFDEIFTSCLMNDSKPKKSYFEKVLLKLKIRPEELLFIDDKAENVSVASKVGINVIHFKNPDQLKKELSKLKIKI